MKVYVFFIFMLTISLSFNSFSIHAQVRNKGVNIESFSKEYFSIPFVDLDNDTEKQVVVDKENGQYLGHPTTVLMEDGRTIFCIYPKGHAIGALVMKKSEDGGLTWSERLNVPKSWETSVQVPTLYPVEDAAGKKRLILFTGKYPARMSYSEDKGQSWTEFKPVGDWGGRVVMGDVIPLYTEKGVTAKRHTKKGCYMAMFHDDQQYFTNNGRPLEEKEMANFNMPEMTIYKTFSYDGGLTWGFPQPVFKSRIILLFEPGIIRSPDGKQIAVLLRENSRRMNSFVMFSNDEGKNWTPPRQLPNSLTGDRHQAIYLPDGRLFISFRDYSIAGNKFRELKNECKNCDENQLYKKAGPISPTHGDWVAWVGTYDDIATGNEGQYRIRLKDNTNGADCAYPALELLPDSTIVATTYGYWDEGEKPYILCVRFKIDEIDKLGKK